jgi:hypothetical protein
MRPRWASYVELALADPGGELLGVFLVDGLGGALDQARAPCGLRGNPAQRALGEAEASRFWRASATGLSVEVDPRLLARITKLT